MLGSEVVEECRRLDLGHICTDTEVDIADPLALREFTQGKEIGWVINCAAYTAVDKAEEETDLAFRINATGAGNVAKTAQRIGARMLHISTDYVFDGTKDAPYLPDDEPNPVSAYGRSKLEGERQVLANFPDAAMVRTAWLYGVGGANFVTTMLRLMDSRSEVKLVDDQRGSPTLALDLARAIVGMVNSEREVKGTYHFTNSGETTWYGFASEIYKLASKTGLARKELKLTPIATTEYPTPAARPAYSVLDCTRIERDFGVGRRPWQEALAEHITRLTEASR